MLTLLRPLFTHLRPFLIYRVTIRDAVWRAFTSMNSSLTPVNDWQKSQFELYDIRQRDPMFLTMLIALEIDTFPSLGSIIRHTDSLNAVDELQTSQWLHNGMSTQEVQTALSKRQMLGHGGHNFRHRADFDKARRNRTAADAVMARM